MKIGVAEIIVILLVILIAVGPDRLPEYAKKLGEGLAQFKKISNEATKEIKESVVEPLEEAQRPLKEALEPIEELQTSVQENVNEVQRSLNSIGKPKTDKKKTLTRAQREETLSEREAALAAREKELAERESALLSQDVPEKESLRAAVDAADVLDTEENVQEALETAKEAAAEAV